MHFNSSLIRTAAVLAGVILLSMAVVACQPLSPEASQPSTEASGTEAGQLSDEQLANATYSGIYEEPVTLTDGVYEGEPFVDGGASRPMVTLVENSSAHGDLNGDGVDDAAVLLAENSGGSGVFSYVGAQVNQDGQPVDAGTVLLGDRIQLMSLVIENGQVVVDAVVVGPDEPMCCGTLKVRNSYALQGGMLAQVGSEEMGNVSLDDLMGTGWVLNSLNFDQPALEGVEVTAQFADGMVAGSAGCNNYNAGVSSEGGQQLTVSLGISTMMACEEPIMNQETQYLAALQEATQWSYFLGQLAITYQSEDGNLGTLLYDAAPPQ